MATATKTPTATSPTTTPVRALKPAEAREAAALLARGFAEEPGNVTLFPDPEARRVVFETSSYNMLRSTLPYGTVHVVEDGGSLAAIALWHPPGSSTTSLASVARGAAGKLANATTLARALPHKASVLLGVAPQAVGLARARGRAVAEASRGATWHLAFLATAPEHRGKGYARALLDRQLLRCDQDGAPVWLETTDPVNPPIYERFGFKTLTHIEHAAWLPGFWVMRREPRPA